MARSVTFHDPADDGVASGQFVSGGDIVELASFPFDEVRLHEFHERFGAPIAKLGFPMAPGEFESSPTAPNTAKA